MFKTLLFLLFFYTITCKLSSMSKATTHPTTNRAFELTILHTNDVHARFEPFTDKGTSCKADKVCYGGVVRRGSYVKQVKATESNVLLLDAGDQYQGTPWFFTYKGAAASLFLNELNYTAMALGNHEFDNGVEGLRYFLSNVTVPILCSNLVHNDKVPDFMENRVKDHIVVNFTEKRVGIIGYITKEVSVLSSTEGLLFDDEKVIKDVAQNLEKKGINIIIALGHSGLLIDKNMAAKIPEIDVFVGGHAHSFLYNGTPPTEEIVAGSYPVIVPRKNSTGLVVHAGPFGKYVGKIKVKFDENGKVSSWSGNPVLMDSSIPEDENLQEKVNHLKVEIEKLYGKVMGSTAMDFDIENNICRAKECEMGNMYADAMMDYNHKWKADVAIVNSGLFRASLSEGNVTYGDALTVLPFQGAIKFISLIGSYLRLIFEHSVEDFSLIAKHGKFLQVSNIFVKYDLTRSNGDRVVDLQIYNKASEQYEELTDDREYRIIIPGWLVKGGDGYEVLKLHHKDLNTKKTLESDIFTEYLKKHSPIKAKLDGRINGMTTYPGWSEVYTEVPWNPPKNPNANSSRKYQASLSTIIIFILLQFLFSASYLR